MTDYQFQHMTAEIYALLEGRDFSPWSAATPGWQQWFEAACRGEWF